MAPNHFGTRDLCHGKQFLHGPGCRGWFGEDSGAFHLLCTLFLLSLHQLHLRSPGTRFQRLGTSALRTSEGVWPCQHLDQKWIPIPTGMELGGTLCFSVLFLCSQFLMGITSPFFHPPSLCTSFLSSFLSIGSVYQSLPFL